MNAAWDLIPGLRPTPNAFSTEVRMVFLHWCRVHMDFYSSAGPTQCFFCAGADLVGFCVLVQCLDWNFVPAPSVHTIEPIGAEPVHYALKLRTVHSGTRRRHWDGMHQMQIFILLLGNGQASSVTIGLALSICTKIACHLQWHTTDSECAECIRVVSSPCYCMCGMPVL